jgi:hypothetical protein
VAVAYRSSGTFVDADSTTTGSIGLPAGLANGDVLILPVQSRGTGNTVATPSGYTSAGTINITASHRLTVFYKYVTNAAGEAAPSVTQSVSGAIRARLSAFSGGSSTSPLDIDIIMAKSTDNATVTAPTATPVSQGTMAVWIFSTADDNALGSATQGTTAYSSDGTAGNDGSLALVYELQTNAAAVGTCSMTQSANGPDNWNTATLILRPAAVAASNPSRTIGYDGITYAIEMAFGSSPFAPEPTWTDISAYVRAADGINVTRGRSSEFSDVQTGTMSFALDNRDRRFDPDYSAGPYFGQLVPMVRCRFRVRYSSTNYPIFDGYVAGWPQSYQYPREAVVAISCVDLFARLATRKLPPTLLALQVLTGQPSAYFMFDEDDLAGSGTAVDLSGYGHTGTFNNLTSVETLLQGEPGRNCKRVFSESPHFTPSPFHAQGDPLILLRTFELWVQPDELDPFNSGALMTWTAYSNNALVELSLSQSTDGIPELQAILYDAAIATVGDITVGIPLGQPLHIVTVLDSTGTTFTVYVNGNVVGSFSASGGTFEGGSNEGVLSMFVIGAVDVRFAHVALYETELSAATILEHYDAGTTGGNLQTATDRMEVLAEFCGLIDAGLYDGTALKPNTHLGRPSFSGSALTAMQAILTSEQGRLFVTADGVLAPQGRTADMADLAVNITSNGTLADSGSLAYSEVPIDSNLIDLIRNAIYVGTAEGATISAIDVESVTLFDEQEDSVSTELSHPVAAYNLGLSRLRRFADPVSRIPQVQLKPHGASDARYPIVFGAELGWRFLVNRTPQAVGSAISKKVTVEGITHTISGAQWISDLFLAPAVTSYTEQPWFVVGDATYGVVGAAAGNQVPY